MGTVLLLNNLYHLEKRESQMHSLYCLWIHIQLYVIVFSLERLYCRSSISGKCHLGEGALYMYPPVFWNHMKKYAMVSSDHGDRFSYINWNTGPSSRNMWTCKTGFTIYHLPHPFTLCEDTHAFVAVFFPSFLTLILTCLALCQRIPHVFNQ